MKKITLFASLLFSIGALAQPQLQSSNFPANFSATYYDFDTTLTEGPAGANQTWNFSGVAIDPDSNYTMTLIPVNTAPFHEDFPLSNYCYKIFNEFYAIYFFWRVNASVFEALGTSGEDAVYENFSTDTNIVLQFPYQYNSVITDSYTDSLNEYSGTNTRTYDAYGTLVTPYGTYTNVIRQKRVEIEDGDENVGYSWLSVNPFFEIMNINSGGGYGSVAGPNVILNTDPVAKNSFAVYPNPVQKEVTIKSQNAIQKTKLTIHNLEGKVMRSNINMNSDQTTVDFQDFPHGIYLLEITDENNKVLHLEKIIKQ